MTVLINEVLGIVWALHVTYLLLLPFPELSASRNFCWNETISGVREGTRRLLVCLIFVEGRGLDREVVLSNERLCKA